MQTALFHRPPTDALSSFSEPTDAERDVPADIVVDAGDPSVDVLVFELVERPRVHADRVAVETPFHEIVREDLDHSPAFRPGYNGDGVLFAPIGPLGVRNDEYGPQSVAVRVLDEDDRSLSVRYQAFSPRSGRGPSSRSGWCAHRSSPYRFAMAFRLSHYAAREASSASSAAGDVVRIVISSPSDSIRTSSPPSIPNSSRNHFGIATRSRSRRVGFVATSYVLGRNLYFVVSIVSPRDDEGDGAGGREESTWSFDSAPVSYYEPPLDDGTTDPNAKTEASGTLMIER